MAQPLASASELTHEDLARIIERQFPEHGATECRFKFDDAKVRGEWWIAIDWESQAVAFAQAHSFFGRTKDGRIYGSSASSPTIQYIRPEDGPEVQFGRKDLGTWIPAFRLLDAMKRSLSPVVIRPAGEGDGIVVETTRPTPEGDQLVTFHLDAWARVVEVRAGEPYPGFSDRYVYGESSEGAQVDALIPIRVVRKFDADRDIVSVRIALNGFEQASEDMFAPERARMEAISVRRRVMSTPVAKKFAKSGSNQGKITARGGDEAGESLTRTDPTMRVQAKSPVRARSAALIIVGTLLIVIAIVVTIRRHA